MRYLIAGTIALFAAIGATSNTHTLPPCATEDGPGPCYWDAQARGKGQGHSFYVSRDGEVSYR